MLYTRLVGKSFSTTAHTRKKKLSNCNDVLLNARIRHNIMYNYEQIGLSVREFFFWFSARSAQSFVQVSTDVVMRWTACDLHNDNIIIYYIRKNNIILLYVVYLYADVLCCLRVWTVHLSINYETFNSPFIQW